jgi:hypothetical protein
MNLYFFRYKNSADLMIRLYAEKPSLEQLLSDRPLLQADATLDIHTFDRMNTIGQFEYLGETDDVKVFQLAPAMQMNTNF